LKEAAEIKAEQDGETQENKEKNCYVQKPTVIAEDFIAEMIWDRKTLPKYLKYYFNDKQFEETTEISLGETNNKKQNIIYVPVFNDSLKKGLVIVPSGYTETTFKEVFEEIDNFSKKAYDACGQEPLVSLLTRVAVGSWFLDRFVANSEFDIAGAGKFAPILPIRGPSQSGKNRLAFVLRLLSYRPYFEMSTYRIPSLYRPLDLWQGTLVLDEADFANTNEKSELVHFLNCRATGTPLSRQNPKNPRYTDTFSNFGLTILTQRKAFDDNATESRALPYYSEVSDKKLPVLETDQMLKEGLTLQNKLLFLRMAYFNQVEIDKSTWIDDLVDHRLIASLLPLLALSKYEPQLKTTITETAKAVERAKIEEKANSMDGTIINYLWEKIKEANFAEYQKNLFYFYDSTKIIEGNSNEKMEKTVLTTQLLGDKFKWSSRTIRTAINSLNIAKKGLPQSISIDGKTHRVIFFEGDRIERRLREFVPDYLPNQIHGKKEITQITQITLSRCGLEPKNKEEGQKKIA
jgi:hypothetical protein